MRFGAMGARGGFGGMGTALGGVRMYQGPVMTGSRWPQFAASPQVYFNSQSPHYAVDSGSRLKIVLSNAYGLDLTTNLGNMTYKAAIWSASGSTLGSLLGTFLFSGSTSGVCAAGALLESDWLSLNYTKGTQYVIRIWGNGAGTAIPFYQSQNGGNMDSGHGNQYENSSTLLADKTTDGSTITTSNAKNHYSPIAVIGDTTLPSIMAIGDSLFNSGAASLGDTFDGTSPRLGYADRVAGTFGTNGYAFVNLAVPGERANQFTNSFRATIARTYGSHVWCNYMHNDVVFGRAAAQIYADLQAIWAYFPSKKVLQAITTTRTTGAWTLADRSDQTVASGFDVGQALDTLVTSILASGPSAGVTDARSAVENLTDRKWLANGVAGKYTPEGIHLSQFASQTTASSGLITASQFIR